MKTLRSTLASTAEHVPGGTRATLRAVLRLAVLAGKDETCAEPKPESAGIVAGASVFLGKKRPGWKPELPGALDLRRLPFQDQCPNTPGRRVRGPNYFTAGERAGTRTVARRGPAPKTTGPQVKSTE